MLFSRFFKKGKRGANSELTVSHRPRKLAVENLESRRLLCASLLECSTPVGLIATASEECAVSSDLEAAVRTTMSSIKRMTAEETFINDMISQATSAECYQISDFQESYSCGEIESISEHEPSVVEWSENQSPSSETESEVGYSQTSNGSGGDGGGDSGSGTGDSGSGGSGTGDSGSSGSGTGDSGDGDDGNSGGSGGSGELTGTYSLSAVAVGTLESADGYCLVEGRAGVSGGTVPIEDASYVQITTSSVPFPNFGRIEISGAATYGSDYQVYLKDGDSYTRWSGAGCDFSGGSITFCVLPVNDSDLESLEGISVNFSIWVPNEDASSGGTFYLVDSLDITIVDDDIEFVSDADYDATGNLPTNSTDPFPKNNDSYAGYIFTQPGVTGVQNDELRFVTPISAMVKNDYLTPIVYTIESGNDLGYFSINSSTGVISLTDAYFEEEAADFPSVVSLSIKASLSGELESADYATVNISRFDVGLQPYTPQTKYIGSMPLARDKWTANGVGIRRNNDYDSGSSLPDSEITSSISSENDLIKTNVIFTTGSGLSFFVEKSSDSVSFWRSGTKANGSYVFTDGELALSGSGGMWAEYTAEGNENCSFSLVVRNSHTGVELYRESASFHPFNSMTCVFVGENEIPGNSQEDPGLNDWTVRELQEGYDVWVWDDGYDTLNSSGDCLEDGTGHAFNEIANAVNNRGVSEIALIGYSHGGGSVYNLSTLLYEAGGMAGGNSSSTMIPVITKPYQLVFTAYVDAVKNEVSVSGITSEDRRPLGSDFHLNIYQTNNTWLVFPIHGTAVNNSTNIHITVEGIKHSADLDDEQTDEERQIELEAGIDTNSYVQNQLDEYFRSKVAR